MVLTLQVSSFIYSCAVYDGSQCTTIFGRANISSSPALISSLDIAVSAALLGDGVLNYNPFSYNTNCQNLVRLIRCIQLFTPCPGTVWCGSSSKDALKTVFANACGCINAESCIIGTLHVSTTIDLLSYYYEGNSTTGPVGLNNNTVCQDVTSGEKCAWLRAVSNGHIMCMHTCTCAVTGHFMKCTALASYIQLVLLITILLLLDFSHASISPNKLSGR